MIFKDRVFLSQLSQTLSEPSGVSANAVIRFGSIDAEEDSTPQISHGKRRFRQDASARRSKDRSCPLPISDIDNWTKNR